jgi:Na+/serine symporter
MSRGKLDRRTARKLEDQLPDVNAVRCASLELNPDMISIGFPVGSTIPLQSKYPTISLLFLMRISRRSFDETFLSIRILIHVDTLWL